MLRKIIIWAWRRISDYFTSLDILESFGWNSKVTAVVSSVLIAVLTSLSGAAWYYSFGLAIGTVLVILGTVIAWQNYQFTTKRHDQPPLSIEYVREQSLFIESDAGHGINRGPWIVGRIKLANMSDHPLYNTKVSIVSVMDCSDEFPQHLQRGLHLPYRLPFSGSRDEFVTVTFEEQRLIDVFQYHQIFWNCHLRLGSKDGPDIHTGPYAIVIQATSLEDSSDKREFVIGLCQTNDGKYEPHFQPLFVNSATPEQRRAQLYDLRVEGIQLRNESVSTPAMFDAWNDRYEIWHLRVLRTASAVDPILKNQLKPLNTWTPWNVGRPVHEEHRHALEIISETVSRMETYLGLKT